MSERTFNLDLPFVMPDQAQKHVTINEFFGGVDDLLQIAIINRTLLQPPASPMEGDRYLIASPATDDWAAKENQLASFRDGAWVYYKAQSGWRVWDQQTSELLIFDGSAWSVFAPIPSQLQQISLFGLGTGANESNPFSAKLNNALWTALETANGGTGDLRYTLNKESPSNVLSFLFQSNWQGRAEIGLVGDDDFSFKVSADGNNFIEGLRFDKNTAAAAFAIDVQTPSLNGGPLGGYRNLLVNGGFDIWQRGTSFAAAVARYGTADRWAHKRNASQTGAVFSQVAGDLGQYALRLHRDLNDTSTKTLALAQFIDESTVRAVRGQNLTLSFRARHGADFTAISNRLRIRLTSVDDAEGEQVISSSLIYGSGSANYTSLIAAVFLSIDSNWTTYTLTSTTTVPFSAKGMQVHFEYTPQATAGVDDWFEIEQVQLEIGQVATAFERREKELELLRCQAYYSQVEGASGFAVSSTNIRLRARFPTSMRTTPTISLIDPSLAIDTPNGLQNANSGSITATSNIGRTSAVIELDGFSNLTSAEPIICQNATPVIALDSEV